MDAPSVGTVPSPSLNAINPKSSGNDTGMNLFRQYLPTVPSLILRVGTLLIHTNAAQALNTSVASWARGAQDSKELDSFCTN